MGDKSKIEWTEATWSPVQGCEAVSPGCAHCYAGGLCATRLRKTPKYQGLAKLVDGVAKWTGVVRTTPNDLQIPLRWTKPRRIFVNSMSDTFHEDVPDEFLDRMFAVMALTPRHTYQVLTKRIERAAEYLGSDATAIRILKLATLLTKNVEGASLRVTHAEDSMDGFQLPNVWIGTSVEDQKRADERIPHLLKCPAAVRFLSCEPLLGPVDLLRPAFDGSESFSRMGGIDWVIVGGESGPRARPMHPDWVRTIRDECGVAGVPFFFKQWGEWRHGLDLQDWTDNDLKRFSADHGNSYVRVGKKRAGRVLDGRTWDEMPKGIEKGDTI